MQTITREERLEEMQRYYADVAQYRKLSQLDHSLRDQKRPSASRLAAPPVVLPSPQEDELQQDDERHAQLEALLDTLSPKLRTVARLHLGFDGQALSFQEIRTRLGLRGRSTASTRYAPAMQKLQAFVSCR
jgi:DNA-directed RNA polymerase sigma subunit (sigma70/sigma32)